MKTVIEAKKLLVPPLVFGNEDQIKAVNFVEQVESAIQSIRNCKWGHDGVCEECDGSGYYECPHCGTDDVICEDCNGSTANVSRGCTCLVGYTTLVVDEAIRLYAEQTKPKPPIYDENQIKAA